MFDHGVPDHLHGVLPVIQHDAFIHVNTFPWFYSSLKEDSDYIKAVATIRVWGQSPEKGTVHKNI